MSGQWEVVGKKNKGAKGAPAKKKPNANGPKVEDVLTVSQIRSLFKSDKTNNSNNKENKKPKEKAAAPQSPKKQKKPEKAAEPPKQKPPKSIESALNGITADEFKNVFESSKASFPDAPIIWLKELVQFLNRKLPIEVSDPVFRGKSNEYPLSAVPSHLKNIIERSLKEAGKPNVRTFFSVTLTSMATDMSHGSSALGHKILLQQIALSDPKSAASNLNAYVTLRNSYQNRPPIGLSILWAVGQIGAKDFKAGLAAFKELMLPLIEMKNYSKFVVEYLLGLLRKSGEVQVTKEEFLMLFDVVLSKRKGFPTDLAQQLNKAASELKGLFERCDAKRALFVEVFLKKLTEIEQTQTRNLISELFYSCLLRDQNSFNAWAKLYSKNLQQSTLVLSYILKNWKEASSKLDRKQLSDTLNAFSTTNEELGRRKRKEAGLHDAVAAVKSLQEAMTARRKSGFPLKRVVFLVLVAVGGFIYYDCNTKGGWNKSTTQQFLHDLGLCKYARRALDGVKDGVSDVDKYFQDNYPEQYKKTVEFSEPYVQLSRDAGLVAYNTFFGLKEYVVEKYPVVLQTVESYAPGLVEQSQKAVNQAVSVSVFYINRSVDFFKNEVFVGQLSPENMQRVVAEAFNTTQQKAAECYHWLYEKIRVTVS